MPKTIKLALTGVLIRLNQVPRSRSLTSENAAIKVSVSVKMTPTKAGTYAIVCNEYCGIGHHTMLGRIYVK